MIHGIVLVFVALAALSASSVAASKCYGPVGRVDTLWQIARHLRPDPSISPQRMMLALLKENPQSFARPNVNALLEGTTLCFESPDSIEPDDDAAIAEVYRHNLEWRSNRASNDASGYAAAEAEAAPAATASRPDVGERARRSADPGPLEPAVRSQGSDREPVSVRLEHLVTALESRLVQAEDRIRRLESDVDDKTASRPQDSELGGTAHKLDGAYRGVVQRLDHIEERLERPETSMRDAHLRNELSMLSSRLGEVEAAARRLEPAAPGVRLESSSASLLLARLDEDQIRGLIAYLDAEGAAIEGLRLRLRASLPRSSFAPSSDGDRAESTTPAAASGHQSPGAAPAPRSEAAMEPMPTPAPRSEAAMEPMPTPAPRSEATDGAKL